MPTVEVSSSPLTPSARLRAALRLTRWLAAHGSDAEHVVVSFHTLDPMAYFSGGMPLTSYGGDGTTEDKQVSWASVVCHIHPGHDHAYRAGLAEEIRDTLGAGAGTRHLMVRFEPTQPDRVFYLESESESMTSGDPVPDAADLEKGIRHAHT